MQSVTTRAPGRINLIGEHVDYLNGFVMPAAINFEVVMRVQKNGTYSTVNAVAQDIDDSFSFDLQDYHPQKQGWPNYIMGVFYELEQLGAQFQGCDISFSSTIPIGAGLSSSAALECSLALAINTLWDLKYDRIQLAQATQLAEHHFVGIQCGIMDQFASLMGQENTVMLLDCQNLEYAYYPLDLGDYRILLLDSHVSHQLADSAYNDRREASEKGLQWLQTKFPQINTFRDVNLGQLDALKSQLGETIYRRCLHAVSEIQRTQSASQVIPEGDLRTLGNLLYESHQSLKDDYEVTCTETDFLVDFTRNNPHVLGARQMGGGFGGCTINLIHNTIEHQFIHEIRQAYLNQFQKDLSPYSISMADGASIISTQ